MKITKTLIKEIIKLNKPTTQDINVLKGFIYNCLKDKQTNSKLFFEALARLNKIEEVI